MSANEAAVPSRAAGSAPLIFGAGAAVGVLGGMIGLGGAEFRLPLLISLFGFAALSAVIVNKAMSLLLGAVPDLILIPALAAILLISAVKLARHAPAGR
ncbi:hypothetical protein [Streptosporangium sp. LJ11]|uniref:hypothetical protein n=1 Tax=Streptosporangium sp. LJ11 TaxID=3436927 RepID=UPI003F79CDE2